VEFRLYAEIYSVNDLSFFMRNARHLGV